MATANWLEVAGEQQVEGVKPSGFSREPECCLQAQAFFLVLASQMEVVTRRKFIAALRWKYQWGDSIPNNSPARVVNGLTGNIILVKTWAGEEGKSHPDDVLVVVEGGLPPPPSPGPSRSSIPSKKLKAVRAELLAMTRERDEAKEELQRIKEQLRKTEDELRQAKTELAEMLPRPKALEARVASSSEGSNGGFRIAELEEQLRKIRVAYNELLKSNKAFGERQLDLLQALSKVLTKEDLTHIAQKSGCRVVSGSG